MVPLAFHQMLLLACLAAVARAQRHLLSPQDLRPEYDFVVVGGGTSGLTIADRLSERLVNKTVLVIEFGKSKYAPGIFDPPQTIWGGSSSGAARWVFSSLPNREVDNKQASVFAGATVGGSSSVNGMFFDRPSRFDFDAWVRVGSPEFSSSPHKWDHNGLFPYFKKAVTFTPPPPAVVEEYGFTWNMSAYGGHTPIHSSFPPFQWADHRLARDAWSEAGVWTNNECASGDKAGLCWVPISEHPLTSRRSHAGIGHFANITGDNNTSAPRNNYDLLTSHQVVRVVYVNGITSGPPLVEVKAVDDGSGKSRGPLFNVTAKAEVILSAGVFNTPTILHRSGIGPASILRKYGIPLVLDLPGVGSNLQDHSGASVAWNYTKPGKFYPMPADMLNATFAAQAEADFNKLPAQGPYTLSMSNSAIFVPLPNITINYPDIITKIRALAENNSFTSYLPPDYASDATSSLYSGYRSQLLALADLLENPSAPSLESGFATGTTANAINLHTLSRGTVRLDPADHLAQPLLDYRTASNPVDFDMYKAHIRYLRRMISTPTLRETYGAVEVGPGDAVADDDAALMKYVKDKMTLSFMHPCCTAAMVPRSKGGVVGPDLKLHGAAGLRVVDMSVLPMLPSSHLSQLAYAVGEKAADIIIGK